MAVAAPDAGGGGVGTSWLKPAVVEVEVEGEGVGGDDPNGGTPFLRPAVPLFFLSQLSSRHHRLYTSENCRLCLWGVCFVRDEKGALCCASGLLLPVRYQV